MCGIFPEPFPNVGKIYHIHGWYRVYHARLQNSFCEPSESQMFHPSQFLAPVFAGELHHVRDSVQANGALLQFL